VKELTWLIHHVMRQTQPYTREVQSWPLSTNGDYEDRAHNYNLYYDKKWILKYIKLMLFCILETFTLQQRLKIKI
jgi:hypothetical protein